MSRSSLGINIPHGEKFTLGYYNRIKRVKLFSRVNYGVFICYRPKLFDLNLHILFWNYDSFYSNKLFS